MEKLKKYLLQNFEQLLCCSCGATVTINYFIPQKTAFLNFYFLPIIPGRVLPGPAPRGAGRDPVVILVSRTCCQHERS